MVLPVLASSRYANAFIAASSPKFTGFGLSRKPG